MCKFRLILSLVALLILSSTPMYAQWTRVLHTQGQCTSIVVSDTSIYTGFDRNFGIYVSTDQGTNWTPIDSGLTNTFMRSIAVKDSNLFAGANTGIFMSADKGLYWTAINTGLPKTSIGTLVISGTYLFAGTSGQGVFRLNINNINSGWTPIDNGLCIPNVPTSYLDSTIDDITVSGTNLFTATNNGVFRSVNNGTSWDSVNTGLPGKWPTEASCFAVEGSNLYVGTYGNGIFLSTNSGATWDSLNSGLTNRYINFIISVDSTHLLAGTQGNGVYLSTNNSNWTPINSGLTNLLVFCLAFDGTYLYAGTGGNSTQGGGVWRRPFSDITSVRETNTNQIPVNYSLQQNYPNPFNPSTTIVYSVPKQTNVTIKIYNILGKRIETLVNKEKPAGTYELTWNAENLPSGIYFYKLRAGSFEQTKKMILLK